MTDTEKLSIDQLVTVIADVMHLLDHYDEWAPQWGEHRNQAAAETAMSDLRKELAKRHAELLHQVASYGEESPRRFAGYSPRTQADLEGEWLFVPDNWDVVPTELSMEIWEAVLAKVQERFGPLSLRDLDLAYFSHKAICEQAPPTPCGWEHGKPGAKFALCAWPPIPGVLPNSGWSYDIAFDGELCDGESVWNTECWWTNVPAPPAQALLGLLRAHKEGDQ